MEIEHVAWVRFTSWWTTQQQGDLTVRNSLLGQVIVDDQGVFTAVTEVLAHGAAGVRRQELQCSRFRGAGGNNDGVGQGTGFFELAHDVGDGRLLLANGHVYAEDTAVFLVDDRIDRHGSLTDLTVTNDQLTLTTANRDHGVDRLVASLYRLVYRLTPDHAWSNFLDRVGLGVVQRTFAVDRVTQCVHDATQQFLTNRNFQDATGALGAHALGEGGVRTQYHRTYGVLLQVQCHTVYAARELDHFAVHSVGQTVDPYDTVGNAYDGTFVTGLGADIELLDATLDDFTNFGRIELLHCSAAPSNSRFQCFGQFRDFAANRAIDYQVAGADDDAADQAGILRRVQAHFPAEPCTENLGEFVLLFLVQRKSTGDFHVHGFLLFCLVQVEQSGNLRQKQETVVFRGNMNEILCRCIELVTANVNECGGLFCACQSRGLEQALHGVVFGHCSSQAEHG